MSTSLKQLGEEYEKSIQIQSQVIKKNREKLNLARKSYNFKEVKRLNSLLKLLYEEKWEMEEKVVQIRKYYT